MHMVLHVKCLLQWLTGCVGGCCCCLVVWFFVLLFFFLPCPSFQGLISDFWFRCVHHLFFIFFFFISSSIPNCLQIAHNDFGKEGLAVRCLSGGSDVRDDDDDEEEETGSTERDLSTFVQCHDVTMLDVGTHLNVMAGVSSNAYQEMRRDAEKTSCVVFFVFCFSFLFFFSFFFPLSLSLTLSFHFFSFFFHLLFPFFFFLPSSFFLIFSPQSMVESWYWWCTRYFWTHLSYWALLLPAIRLICSHSTTIDHSSYKRGGHENGFITSTSSVVINQHITGKKKKLFSVNFQFLFDFLFRNNTSDMSLHIYFLISFFLHFFCLILFYFTTTTAYSWSDFERYEGSNYKCKSCLWSKIIKFFAINNAFHCCWYGTASTSIFTSSWSWSSR